MKRQENKMNGKLKEEEIKGVDLCFWKSWEQYKNDLYRVCLKMMNSSKYDARDALGTAMISAYERYTKHAPIIYNLKGWLIRLTRNVCIDIIRKIKREVFYNDEDLEKLAAQSIDNRKTWEFDECNYCESIEENLDREEILSKIHKAIKQLPILLREPALLRFFMKMPYRDIAKHCHISTVNARKRIQQARVILSSQFQGDDDYPYFFLILNKNIKTIRLSPTLTYVSNEARKICNKEFHEIDGIYTASNIISITVQADVEISKNVFFNANLNRRNARLKTLQNYVNNYPNGWKKQMELAELLIAGGNWEQAIAGLHLVLKKYPRSMRAWLKMAEMFMRSDQEEKALQILEAAIPYANQEATRYHFKGIGELCKHRFDLALTEFTRAAELEETNIIHRQGMAMSYILADRSVEAFEAIEKTLSINPSDLYSLSYGYDLLVLMGRLSKADQFVERLLAQYPQDILALKRKVDRRCSQGLVRREGAKETRNMIHRLRKLAPHTVEVKESQAIYHFYRGEFKKAISSLKCITEENPHSLSSWYSYSHWCLKIGAYQTAAEAILKAFKIYKKDPRIHCCACEILPLAGMKDLLKMVIQDMLLNFPGHWSTCSSAGLALATVYGEIERGLELTNKAVSLQPLLPEAYFRHGKVLGVAGRSGEAIDILLRGWQLLPKDDAGYQSTPGAWLLAQNYKILKDENKTRSWLKEVIHKAEKLEKFFPADGCYWLGKALYELENTEYALQSFRKAISYQLFYPARQEAKFILKCHA